MKKISQREKIMLAIFVYILIIFGFYKYFYLPLNDKLLVCRGEYETLSKQIQEIKYAQQDKSKVILEWQDVSREYQDLEKKVPGDINFVALVSLLENAADNAAVDFISFSYTDKEIANNEETSLENLFTAMAEQEKKAEKQAKKAAELAKNKISGVQNKKVKAVSKKVKPTVYANSISFNITVAGEYYQLLEFLGELENSERVVAVDSCSLALEGKKNNSYKPVHSGVNNMDMERYQSEYYSYNVPPSRPVSKGEQREMDSYSYGEPVKEYKSTTQVQRAVDKYNTNRVKMNLVIHSYYDNFSIEGLGKI